MDTRLHFVVVDIWSNWAAFSRTLKDFVWSLRWGKKWWPLGIFLRFIWGELELLNVTRLHVSWNPWISLKYKSLVKIMCYRQLMNNHLFVIRHHQDYRYLTAEVFFKKVLLDIILHTVVSLETIIQSVMRYNVGLLVKKNPWFWSLMCFYMYRVPVTHAYSTIFKVVPDS